VLPHIWWLPNPHGLGGQSMKLAAHYESGEGKVPFVN
jgi:hypothetical protein